MQVRAQVQRGALKRKIADTADCLRAGISVVSPAGGLEFLANKSVPKHPRYIRSAQEQLEVHAGPAVDAVQEQGLCLPSLST